MNKLYLEPSPEAQWFALVKDASEMTGLRLEEGVESYLVMTLDHFIREINLLSAALAPDFLSAIQGKPYSDANRLRDVGDRCLLLSGLFPERALRKNVSLNYFIDLGKGAYHSISHQEKTHPFDPRYSHRHAHR